MIRNTSTLTFIHSPYNKNLICVETREEVNVELPSLNPVTSYGKRVKEAEEEAKKRYIEILRMKEEVL